MLRKSCLESLKSRRWLCGTASAVIPSAGFPKWVALSTSTIPAATAATACHHAIEAAIVSIRRLLDVYRACNDVGLHSPFFLRGKPSLATMPSAPVIHTRPPSRIAPTVSSMLQTWDPPYKLFCRTPKFLLSPSRRSSTTFSHPRPAISLQISFRSFLTTSRQTESTIKTPALGENSQHRFPARRKMLCFRVLSPSRMPLKTRSSP